MQRIMRTGQNLCLLPGGFQVATLYQRGKHRVYIQKRFGFIKLALQHGYNIYPAYTFGEDFPHIEMSSKEVVKEYQDTYVEALQNLFDSYKRVYAVDPDANLEII
ncbi:unnamed protein product [Peronospora belbahrii]|uniref:diacylglycerol O-acyltransferase n=1 Tax=Peronospora belbahrii TaxID=622444 RepID=A0ABN8CZW2_9STRA|nr:unnamed protein product [Peronospora belbahrii]